MTVMNDSQVIAELRKLRHRSSELVWANKTGHVYESAGIIVIPTGRPDPKGINSNLARVFTLIADYHKLVIELDYMTLGHHVEHSRHYRSQAADCDFIFPVGGAREVATATNPHACLCVVTLRAAGWALGEPPGVPGLILGPVHTAMNPTDIPHAGHLHVSNAD